MIKYNHRKGWCKTVEEILKQLLEGQKQLFKEVQGLKESQQQLRSEITSIKADMATETQQQENNDYIKALLHRTEEMSA
jgi:hypothetical protein